MSVVVAPPLVVQHLGHSFDGRAVVHDLSLTLHPHEIVAIVGPSGCGKTTLLRMCAGLLAPENGLVARSSSVGFVFQEPALLAWRRVVDNARLLSNGNDALVDSLLKISGLDTERRKWPYQLSGGMKMRLSLVRTLAAKPDLVLLDEPFGSLDQITRHHLHAELAHLHRERPFAAILVSHAIDEAVFLADRVMVMSSTPGRFVGEFVVQFDRQRDESLRYSSSFSEVCGQIATCLRDHSA